MSLRPRGKSTFWREMEALFRKHGGLRGQFAAYYRRGNWLPGKDYPVPMTDGYPKPPTDPTSPEAQR